MEFDIEKFDALRDYLTERGYAKSGDTISLKTLAGGGSSPAGGGGIISGAPWGLPSGARIGKVGRHDFIENAGGRRFEPDSEGSIYERTRLGPETSAGEIARQRRLVQQSGEDRGGSESAPLAESLGPAGNNSCFYL